MTLDYAEVPETPPAHIWAFKALRNGLLGSTRPSPPPVTCSASPEDEVDEVRQHTKSISTIPLFLISIRSLYHLKDPLQVLRKLEFSKHQEQSVVENQ